MVMDGALTRIGWAEAAEILDLAGDRGMQGDSQTFVHLADDGALRNIGPLGDRRGAGRADMLAENDFEFIGDRHDFYGQPRRLRLRFRRMNPAFGKSQQRFHKLSDM